jgi:hypothetical protein
MGRAFSLCPITSSVHSAEELRGFGWALEQGQQDDAREREPERHEPGADAGRPPRLGGARHSGSWSDGSSYSGRSRADGPGSVYRRCASNLYDVSVEISAQLDPPDWWRAFGGPSIGSTLPGFRSQHVRCRAAAAAAVRPLSKGWALVFPPAAGRHPLRLRPVSGGSPLRAVARPASRVTFEPRSAFSCLRHGRAAGGGGAPASPGAAQGERARATGDRPTAIVRSSRPLRRSTAHTALPPPKLCGA